MKIHSIRTRLTWWYLTAIIISSAVLFGSFYYMTREILKTQTDREISSHAQAIVKLVADRPFVDQVSLPEEFETEFAQMPGMLVAVWDENGKQLTTSQPVDSGLEELKYTLENSTDITKPKFIDRKIGTLSMRLGIFPVSKEGAVTNLVVVAHPTDVITRSLNRLTQILLLLMLVVGIPAAAGGYLIARGAILPLTRLSQHLAEISSTNLHQQLPNPKTRDEIEHLTTTFNSMLSRLNESFGRERQFIGDVAHELKTPLSTIKSNIEVSLSKKRSYEELDEVLRRNLVDIDRLSATINDVLDLAWSESGEIGAQFVKVDLSRLTHEVEELLRNLSTTKKIQVLAEIEEGVFVMGSPKKLFRAIYNLADNAVKFTPAQGRIALTLKKESDTACLEVSNTGRGISRKDLPRVFERFYRGENENSAVGTGLGLAICKAIINAHHGQINVASTPGKITTFTIQLDALDKSS